jgi:type IV pilus assembly protein PilY1
MRRLVECLRIIGFLIIFIGFTAPGVSAAAMNDYSITPPFIQEAINPNLLLMIDNSASMYDLAYPDLGTATREPYYCFDETYIYSSTNPYTGYFNSDKYYEYIANATNGYFEEFTGTFPATCSKRSTTESGTGTLCLDLDTADPQRVTRFIAKGNYLNWLTASKFDVQKNILTGGKYQGGKLIAESRGCVGRGFVKKALASDYVEGGPNTSLGVSFSIKGAPNDNNYSAPSTGGQTYLYVYLGDYNQGNCQAAIDAIIEGHNPAEIKDAVDICLAIGNKKDLETNKKIIYRDAIQRCWNAYKFDPPDSVGTNGYNDVKNNCPDIYKDRGGIASITAGDADLLCSLTYAGACYTGSAPSWVKDAWTSQDCVIGKYNEFCASLDVVPVTDPTDDPSDTTSYENLPAIISDIGVEAQLGLPLKLTSGEDKLTIRIAVASEPTDGLIQQYANRIRFGGMQFNDYGSAAECSTTPSLCTKVCSNNILQTCSSNNDCPGAAPCIAATNIDGGKVFHNIGKGTCSTTTTTECATDANCPTGEKCESEGVGDNTAGLVRKINDIRGATWTPFAEAFYNSIGYFAKKTSDTTGKTSRYDDLRLNSNDFDNNMNPSQYYCQTNNILIISDGMSTADRRSEVSALADRYRFPAGEIGTCNYYAGSKNLDDLAYLGYNYNINSFSTAATTAKPAIVDLKKNEHIKTFVVFNGSDNGVTGECNSETLMNNTAVRGGGSYFKVENPADLRPKIRQALEEILTGSASGTAASIVSNRGQSGANLITAIFYPEKDFGNNQNISWIGDLQNYWYYFDPFIANSTIREDTQTADFLDLGYDYKIDFVFDTGLGKTMANRYRDNLNGTYTYIDQVTPDDLEALWKAGTNLYKRNLVSNPRTILTSTTGISLLSGGFSTSNKATLYPYLNVSGVDETEKIAAAEKLIKYLHGYDADGFRRRWASGYDTVTTNETTARTTGYGVWKLGDIISSTPKVQSDKPSSGYHLDYGDASYQSFIGSDDYAGRGMVYVGANDGMLHAITLGKVEKRTSVRGDRIAELTGSNKGEEAWAYVPRNALPYLKYFAELNYSHLYYVDNTTLLVDASVKKHDDCTESVYYNCERQTKKTAGNDLIPDETSWRSILIGGMGLGGASRLAGGSCGSTTGTLPDCVKAPINSPDSVIFGLSSFFALDVTNPASPTLKWEFSHEDLGYTLAEPVIVRINGKNEGTGITDSSKNGRWFVVFASGPTGPIEPGSHQFYGKSDKPLKLFVVDLEAQPPFDPGVDYWVIDELHDGTTLSSALGNSFGGSLATNAIDVDKINKISTGRYSTDVVYVGYVKEKNAAGTTTWADGGLLRLVTKEDTNPANWVLSKVIDGDGVGPVTASIDKMYDDNGPDLWLYFGSGRYYYKSAIDGIDSADQQMSLFGIKEPCYTSAKKLDPSCTTSLTIGDLQDQSNAIGAMTGKDGWYVNLDDSDTYNGKEFKAERVITTPGVRTNGLVVFTTFKPTADICGFGGETLFWFVDYGTGGAPPPGTLKGKITIQLSTGAIVVVDLGDLPPGSLLHGGRQFSVGAGKPPSPAPQTDTLKKPVKKILHIQER